MFEIVTELGKVYGPFAARELREFAQSLNDEQCDADDEDSHGWDARVVGS